MMETKNLKVTEKMIEKSEKKTATPEEEFWREPLNGTVKAKKEGKIHIINSRCKGCAFCIEFCPMKVLAQSEEINEKGYHPPEIVNMDACTFCQLCQLICPDIAIYIEVTNSGEEEKDKK